MTVYNHYLNNYINMQEFEGLYDDTFQIQGVKRRTTVRQRVLTKKGKL